MLSNKYLLTTPGSICMGGLKWVRTQVWGKLQGGGGGGCSLKACTRPSNCLLSRPHPGSPPTHHHPSIHWIYPLHCVHFHCKSYCTDHVMVIWGKYCDTGIGSSEDLTEPIIVAQLALTHNHLAMGETLFCRSTTKTKSEYTALAWQSLW